MSNDIDALCVLLEEYKNDLQAAEEENKRLKEILQAEQLARRKEQEEHKVKTDELTSLINVIICTCLLYIYCI